MPSWRDVAASQVPEAFRKPRTVPRPVSEPPRAIPVKRLTPVYEAGKMNKLETRYAMYLEGLRLAGEILRWEHEALTLRLADKTGYTPDFLVVMTDGMVEFHETKGFMRDDAAVKLKVAADRYPKVRFRLVKRVRGEWLIRAVPG